MLEPGKKKRKRAPPVPDADLATYIASGTVFDGYDLVLTSYDVMRNEVNFDGSEARKLRSGSVFRSMSPLRSVRWWRVCMDEVQEIKGAQSAAARMCRELPAVHRWGISGTPIKHSFHDIFGLLVFLGIDDALWKLPAAEIVRRLKPLCWRHSQQHVIDHLSIPPVQEIVLEVQRTEIETYCHRKLQARFPDLPASFWAKFDSAPFDVTYQHLILRPGQRRTQNPAVKVDFDFLWTSLVNLCTTEFRACHIKLAETLLDLAVLRLRRRDPSDMNSVKEAYRHATFALDLMLHRSSDAFVEYVDLEGAGFQMEALTSPAAQLAAFRGAATMIDICNVLGLEEEARAADKIVQAQKQKCLHDASVGWNRAIAKFKRDRTEAGTMRRNRLLAASYRDPWWRLYCRWLREEAPGRAAVLLERLSTGFKIHVDTKLMGGVETLVQIENATLDKLERILEKHFEQLDALRSKFVKKLMAQPPVNGVDLRRFEDELLPELENLLTAYSDHQVSNARTTEDGLDHRKRSISQGEVMLLAVENSVLVTFNEHFGEFTKISNRNEVPDADLVRRLDLLGFLCFESSAQFRELELNKLEILEGSNVFGALRHYISVLRALEDVIETDQDVMSVAPNHEDVLANRVAELKDRCLHKKSELLFLGRNSKLTDPSADRYGSKQSKAVKRLRHQLSRVAEEKALVFSSHSETLAQFSNLLALGYQPIKFVSGRGVQAAGQQPGSFVSRIKEFQCVC